MPLLERFMRALRSTGEGQAFGLAPFPHWVPTVDAKDAMQQRVHRDAQIDTALAADVDAASIDSIPESGWYECYLMAANIDTAAYAARRWIKARILKVDGTNVGDYWEELLSLLNPGDEVRPTFNGTLLYLEKGWRVRWTARDTFAAGEDLLTAVHLVQRYQ